MMTPRDLADQVEQRTGLSSDGAELFSGYGVMAVPFASGHLLAMRRFPFTSVGPDYTSVWHLDPAKGWLFYANRPPMQSCSRVFGSGLEESHIADIELEWPESHTFSMRVPSIDLEWTATLSQNGVSRMLNGMARLMPEPLWHQRAVLGMMGGMAGRLLHAGRLGLCGRVPNGQWFIANPRSMWLIDESSASIGGQSLGPIAPLPEQVRLADFWLPQRGMFAFGQSFFEPLDEARHHAVASRTQQ